MEQISKKDLLKNIGIVYEKAHDCKLSPSFWKEIESELMLLSSYFQVSQQEAFFIAIVFTMNYKGDCVDLNDMIDYFSCNPMVLLEYSDELVQLNNKNIFCREKSRHRMQITLSNDQFTVNEKITEAILNNMPMPQLEKVEILQDALDVLEKFDKLCDQCHTEDISTRELMQETKTLLHAHKHMPLIKAMLDMKFRDMADLCLLLQLIWGALTGKESMDIESVCTWILDKTPIRVRYIQNIIAGTNELCNNAYIELIESSFINNTEAKLADKTLALLKENGLTLFSKKKENKNIISPEDIQYKKLLFNDYERCMLMRVEKILHDKEFRITQQRLEEKSLPKGITCILHGLPGTGKTEFVYQVAKVTNREIMKVDISQSKSMWFGESEKVIKRLFTNYYAYAKECKKTPILLFNEADAIFSKRKDASASNVAQTENAMQNILLEELERFQGIFFATTNLVNNLDAAFERRFLFKVQLQKPCLAIKAKLWKNKLPQLTSVQSLELAETFDFSGGQIENIVRKKEIEDIIKGKRCSYKSILDFCREETFTQKKSRIGYTKSA